MTRRCPLCKSEETPAKRIRAMILHDTETLVVARCWCPRCLGLYNERTFKTIQPDKFQVIKRGERE